MKRLIASILLLAGFLCGARAQNDAMFVYRNDGAINAFLKSDVDSMVCSQLDLDSLMHSDYVVQEIWAADSVYRIPLAVIDSICFTRGLCPDHNHPHAIDLGLPSGTKWACCNVGASTPEGYGGYYAWGETSEKSVYNEATYLYYTGQDTDGDGWIEENFNAINIGSDIAGTSYDVAHVRWGGSWIMPSHDRQMELMNNCTREWTTLNGVNGILVTGPSGGQIFLPAAGYRWGDDLSNAGSYGSYWSSTQNPGYCNVAYFLNFRSGRWDRGYSNLGNGQSVRAVCP